MKISFLFTPSLQCRIYLVSFITTKRSPQYGFTALNFYAVVILLEDRLHQSKSWV